MQTRALLTRPVVRVTLQTLDRALADTRQRLAQGHQAVVHGRAEIAQRRIRGDAAVVLAELEAGLTTAETQLASATATLRVAEGLVDVAWARALAWFRAAADLPARADAPAVPREDPRG